MWTEYSDETPVGDEMLNTAEQCDAAVHWEGVNKRSELSGPLHCSFTAGEKRAKLHKDSFLLCDRLNEPH